MRHRTILWGIAQLESLEALAAHARSLTDDPEAPCIARMLAGAIGRERDKLPTWAQSGGSGSLEVSRTISAVRDMRSKSLVPKAGVEPARF
jgi:hypothetical protein